MTIHFDSPLHEEAFRQAVVNVAWRLVHVLAHAAPASLAYVEPADCVPGSWN